MKFARNILICLAGGLACSAAVRADDVALSDNPYAPVVTRNIFGLNPPMPVVTPQDDATLPKISPNGIMSIFGQWQVLFKVSDASRPGKPPGDDSYILSEGQRQDDIEVVKINEKDGIVTFNNHGTVQQLPLVAATASSGPASGGNPVASFVPPPGGFPGAGNNFAPRSPGNFNRTPGGSYGGNNSWNGNGGGSGANANYGGQNNGLNLNGAGTHNNSLIIQPQSGLNEEQQTLMIEGMRQHYIEVGDPTAQILPPTAATPDPNSGN